MDSLTSTDLEEWARRRDAEEHLPTLIRRLVLATVEPGALRMPAAEGIRLPGFDGIVETSEAAWPVPPGRSLWEMGTGSDPQDKAQRDYRKRTHELSAEERNRSAFVVVTPRRWSGSEDWVSRRVADADGWKAIEVLDGEDLAAWLGRCPGVHAWLASEQLGRHPHGVRSLRNWFAAWSEATDPPIPAGLLLAGRDDDSAALRRNLDGQPSEHVVRADTREEAIAFVAAALVTESSPGSHDSETEAELAETPDADRSESWEGLLERGVVITSDEAWHRCATHEQPLLLVAAIDNPDVGLAARNGHHVVLPRVARFGDEALKRLRRDVARQVWEAAGLSFDRAEEFARSARRSLGALRRRIAKAGHLRDPEWARGPSANLLAPLLLAGGWRDDFEGDLEVVADLADRGWRSVARDLTEVASMEDPPVRIRSASYAFVDVVDAWEALRHALTAQDLSAAVDWAVEVLGERDPMLDVPPGDRWRAATIPGVEARRFSSELRDGMARVLAVMATSPASAPLPGGQTAQDVANRVVRSLLDGADGDRWQSIASLLPTLAEAAPSVFLDLVDESLSADDQPVMRLFDEVPGVTGADGSSGHPSLLWALERLAWSPQHLSRTAVLLARLAACDPGGRLANRPAASLQATLHLVRPQSAVSSSGLLEVVDVIRADEPEVGWKLAADLIRGTSRGMMLHPGPSFRDWPAEQRTDVPHRHVVETLNGLAARLAEDAGGSSERLSEVIGLLDQVPLAGRTRLVEHLEAVWGELDGGGQREVVRQASSLVAKHLKYSEARWALGEAELHPVRNFLERRGTIEAEVRTPELFASFVDFPEFDMTTEAGREALRAARADVVGEVLASKGLGAVVDLAARAEMPEHVGSTLATVATELEPELLELLGSSKDHEMRLAGGYVAARSSSEDGWLQRAAAAFPEVLDQLLLAVRPDGSVLAVVDDLPSPLQERYWCSVQPWSVPDDLRLQVVRRILDVGRAFMAIWLVSVHDEPVPLDLALETLWAPSQDGLRDDLSAISSPAYTIGRLLDRLPSLGATDDQVAELEWLYAPLLAHDRAPTALHRRLAADPEFFAELVTFVYRSDESEAGSGSDDDVTEEADQDEAEREAASHRATVAWQVLHEWAGPLPGVERGSAPTVEAVQAWVDAARGDLADRERSQVASSVIGEALGGAPATDDDGIWPCEAVRGVIEHEKDVVLEAGILRARMNQRGVTSRGAYDGGDQERQMAETYRGWANSIRDRWPRSGAMLDRLVGHYETEARFEDVDAEGLADR